MNARFPALASIDVVAIKPNGQTLGSKSGNQSVYHSRVVTEVRNEDMSRHIEIVTGGRRRAAFGPSYRLANLTYVRVPRAISAARLAYGNGTLISN